MSSTATAARSTRVRGSPAPGRPRGTRAAAAAACRRRRSSRPRARPAPARASARARRSRSSSRSISPGTCAPPASMTAATASALAIRRRPGVQGDDPAGGEDPAHVAQARRGHHGAERLRPREALDRARQVGVGVARRRAAEQRHDPVEPEREERRQRRLRRRRDLEHHDAAARPHDARHLAQARVEVGEVARAEADRGRVERVVRVGQRERVALLPAQARRLRARARRACPRRSPSRRPSPPRAASSIARSPVPVATSSARAPGPTRARSAARSRQRWCSPAVMTEFMRS